MVILAIHSSIVHVVLQGVQHVNLCVCWNSQKKMSIDKFWLHFLSRSIKNGKNNQKWTQYQSLRKNKILKIIFTNPTLLIKAFFNSQKQIKIGYACSTSTENIQNIYSKRINVVYWRTINLSYIITQRMGKIILTGKDFRNIPTQILKYLKLKLRLIVLYQIFTEIVENELSFLAIMFQ